MQEKEETVSTALDWARDYVSRGFSVIPIKRGEKKPSIPWKEFQGRKPTDDELVKWFGGSSNYDIGIVTGKVSGIVVVDLDSEKALEHWRSINAPKTPVVKTGKEHGYHLYYAYPQDREIRNFQKRDDLPGIDLRGDGGYVVAPPSIHESGKQYHWLTGVADLNIPLAPLPDVILKQGSGDKAPLKELYQGVDQGERNNTLARLTGSWANDGLSYAECLDMAHTWNSKNNPPLPEKEVESTVRSIFDRHQNELSNCPHCPTPIAGQSDNRNPQRDDPHGVTFKPEEVLVEGSVLMKLDDIKVEWLVNKLIPKQSITLLHGRGGIGKTWLALMLANAVSKGRRFMELDVMGCPAIYIDYENSYPVLVERVKRLEAEKVLVWHSSAEPPPPKLDSHDWACFKLLPKGLLVIDTLRASQLKDENDSKDMALILNRLKQLRDIGFTILLLHHTPKGNERTYKGSTTIFDLADHVLSLHKVKRVSHEEADDDEEDCLYYFGTKDKTRYELFHIYLEFDKEKGFVVARDPDMDDLESMYEILKEREPMNQSKIFDLIKTELEINSKGRVVKLLRKGEGKYWTAKKDGRATIYCPICPTQGVDNRTDEKDSESHLQLVESAPASDGSLPAADQQEEDDCQIIDDTEGDPLEEV